jgi:putative endonuclease
MAEHFDFGKEAEAKAVAFLENSNYQILAKNWRFKKAEIDIIALDFSTNELVIAEVKARQFNSLTMPEEAVNSKKKKLLVEAANEYVVRNELENEVRFDIISVIKTENPGNSNWKIQQIKNAFFAYE